MRRVVGVSVLLVCGLALGAAVTEPEAKQEQKLGPLRVSRANPHWFLDGSGRAVYLTGSHVWWNRYDRSWAHDRSCLGEAAPWSYDAYLDRLESLGHNFIRLWTWELARWEDCGATVTAPQPWARPGPGEALDGKPRFDLNAWDEGYFALLEERVRKARERGMYVAVMLFEGWSVQNMRPPWNWSGHPFNRANNVNGIDGDRNGDRRGIEVHTLEAPAVTRTQEALARKVVDTLQGYDNVLYEIGNEAGPHSTAWQHHLVRFIRGYQASVGVRRPVGMTWNGDDPATWASEADWISPEDPVYLTNPPVSDVPKVIVSDSDHHCGICGHPLFPWKAMLRGHNPIYMDAFLDEPSHVATRRALGLTRRLAGRLGLARLTAQVRLSSTGYCLARRGVEYVVLQPERGTFQVDLTGARRRFAVRWIDAATGREARGRPVRGGWARSFRPPFPGPSVLWLRALP